MDNRPGSGLVAPGGAPRPGRSASGPRLAPVTGTHNLLLAARDSGVNRVVLASSSSVYGPSAELPRNEDRPKPISPYAVTKLAAEGFCRAFHSVYGLETAMVQVMNMACGERITINRVLAELERLTGRALNPVRGNPRPGEVEHSQADISRASDLLGFSPRILFAEGLARTVEHVQAGSRSK